MPAIGEPTVGFYGGINYGFGYTGVGYAGGYWHGGDFFYNRSVNNVNVVNVHNVYNTTVINNNVTVNRVAYNGGPGGIAAQPTPAEMKAANEPHVEPTSEQLQHQTMAQNNRDLLASVNHGKPAIAATAKPAEFSHGAVAATRAGAPYRAPTSTNEPRANNSVPRPGNEGRGEMSPNEASRASEATRPGSNVPRPANSYREANTTHGVTTNASRPEVPRPPSASSSPNQYRGGNTTNAPTTEHASNVPHPQNTPRPSNNSSSRSTEPYGRTQSGGQTSHETANAPRPQAESHGAKPSPERPERPERGR